MSRVNLRSSSSVLIASPDFVHVLITAQSPIIVDTCRTALSAPWAHARLIGTSGRIGPACPRILFRQPGED